MQEKLDTKYKGLVLIHASIDLVTNDLQTINSFSMPENGYTQQKLSPLKKVWLNISLYNNSIIV